MIGFDILYIVMSYQVCFVSVLLTRVTLNFIYTICFTYRINRYSTPMSCSSSRNASFYTTSTVLHQLWGNLCFYI